MKKLVPGIKVMERPVHGPVHGSVHGPVHGPVMVGTIRMQPPPGSEVHHMPHRGLVIVNGRKVSIWKLDRVPH